MQYLQIKNWEKFQHYKDRNPPWIKLHREVLDDYEITCLQDASRLLQMLLWVLAAQLNNRIPYDLDWLQKRLNLRSKVNLNELIDKGFLVVEQDASTPLAKCSPETEAYREETDNNHTNTGEASKMKLKELPAEWREFAAKEKSWNDETIDDVWAVFCDYWRLGKGKTTKRSDWIATWRTWVRGQKIEVAKQDKSNELDNHIAEQTERLARKYANQPA